MELLIGSFVAALIIWLSVRAIYLYGYRHGVEDGINIMADEIRRQRNKYHGSSKRGEE